MGALKGLAAAFALVVATPVQAEPLDRFAPLIAEAAQRFGVPVAWIVRVIRAESGGQTMRDGRPITSRAGAMGLMQIMPRTWAALRAELGLGGDPHDPRDNILAGAYYLRLLHDRFGYPGLFAAYNAGPARYADYLARRAALPAETRNYLTAVSGSAPQRESTFALPRRASPPPPALFFVRAPDTLARPDANPNPARDIEFAGLFAIDPRH